MQTTSESKENIWGEQYIETKDEHGNVLQISKRKDYAVGGVVYETTDARGSYIGYSVPRADAFGNRYIETFDQSGNLVSRSYERFDYMGNPYWTIENSSGERIGIGQNGVTNYVEPDHETGQNSTNSGSSSRSSGLPGGNLGMIFSLVLLFLIMVLFGMLHDPNGRETIHRFVTPCIGILPIVVILLRSMKVKDVRGPFKNSILILSCALMLIMQLYYLFYTARSMSWLVDTDTILYYVLWLAPYLFLFGYCYLAAKQAMAAQKATPRSDIKRVLKAIYEPTCILFCLCPAVMILRWEFYHNDGMYARTFIEILTILVVVFAGIGLAAVGEKIFSKVTRKAFDR